MVSKGKMHNKVLVETEKNEKKEEKKDKEKKEELEVTTDNPKCQLMMVGLWVKNKDRDEIDRFIDFMEQLGFRFQYSHEPKKKELKGKVLILYFSYNSCALCRIEGVERPLSVDGAMLDFINMNFPNLVYDFHFVNPKCDYLKVKEEEGIIEIGEENGKE